MSPEKFWAQVDRSGDGCWPWVGKATAGRGRANGTYAYRVSWALANGPIPAGLQINHHCDNPICVRPDHLYAGTHLDNMHDMVSRGRNVLPIAPTGLAHHDATVGPEVIAAALAEYRRGGISQADMARRLGVAQSTFGRWVRREARQDVEAQPFRVGKGRPVRLAPCGTRAAYSMHRAKGEAPCGPCTAANARYSAQYRQRRSAVTP